MNEVIYEPLAHSPALALVPAPVMGSATRLRHLDEVRDHVQADSLGAWDTYASRDQLAFKDGQLAFDDKLGVERRLTPTNWATGQLCSRLGIPAPYFRKCPPVLQDVQANYWLREADRLSETREAEDKSKRWMLRAKGETLRAVLSERYSPLDNSELLDALMPTLSARYRVDWFALADEGLHLRIVDPDRAREVLPDDELSVGIHISNSEVGFRSVTVDALIYRLVCKNGLIRLVKGRSLMRQRHVHLARPRLLASLEEAVASAWNEAEGFLGQVKRTTLMPVDDVEGTIERLGERWHLPKPVQDDVLLSLRREPAPVQETVYGVVNALTNVAQRLSDEARYDMEVLAGHVAEQGVGAYAPKRPKARQSEAPDRMGEVDLDPPEYAGFEEAQFDDTGFDVVEAAREMFEAEVVSRRSLSAPPKEVVES